MKLVEKWTLIHYENHDYFQHIYHLMLNTFAHFLSFVFVPSTKYVFNLFDFDPVTCSKLGFDIEWKLLTFERLFHFLDQLEVWCYQNLAVPKTCNECTFQGFSSFALFLDCHLTLLVAAQEIPFASYPVNPLFTCSQGISAVMLHWSSPGTQLHPRHQV